MKKILLIGYFTLLTACQSATLVPSASLFPTSTPQAPRTSTFVPATFTPEPTSTPAPSPTPFPRLFTNEFDSSLEGWVILQAGNREGVPNIRNEGSSLTLQMDSPHTWLYALYGAHDYPNVRIDMQFTNRALTPASAGLICRYSEEHGWLEYNVFSDGTYNVLYGKWLDVGIPEFLPITAGSSNQIQPSGTTQSVGLACSDTTLFLYVGQTLLRQVDVSRYELTQGKIGLTAASYENTPIVVGFDWVTASEP
jgi:hypothetical protein